MVELITVLVIAAIFVGIPLVGISTVYRHLTARDKRVHVRHMEELNIRRDEIENRKLELQIRQSAYDLAQKQLEAGQQITSLHEDV